MPNTNFSCFLIGGDTLLVECAQILLREGHDIRGVVTASPQIVRWCAEHAVPVIDSAGEYGEVLAEEPFDYLFAITHLAIIPAAVLELPRKLAVNFHDGPLPRYAGLNTPVWALVNGEREYGISWHVITQGVDMGDLLKRQAVEITAEETALSLNTKCMAAAVDSFPALISELAEGREERSPQDTSLRTYFGKFTRLPAAASIDWRASAGEIDALVRALSFGPYPNPVGVAKAAREGLEGEPFCVTAARVEAGEPEAAREPGEVVEVSPEGIVVATPDGAVRILEVKSLDGSDLRLQDLDLSVGMQLGPSPDVAERLTEVDGQLCRHEDFWARRLRGAEPPDVPQATTAKSEPEWNRFDIDIPGDVRSAFGEAAVAAVLTAFGVYLARTGRKERFTVSLRSTAITGDMTPVERFYSSTVPMSVDLGVEWTGGQAVRAMSEELALVHEKRGYLRDLVARDPELVGRGEWAKGFDLPVGVEIGGSETPSTPPGSLLSLVIRDDTHAQLVVDGDRLSDADALAVRDGLSECLRGLATDPGTKWTELALVPEAGLEQQLVGWNTTAVPRDLDLCVHEAFEAQVDLTPDATALIFEGTSVTYRELDERANSLARFLQEHGVGLNELVGVHIERSIDLMVATLGVMKAGAAYVPLDPHFPADRLSLMISDSGARVLVTQAKLEGALPSTDARIVRIDTGWEEISAHGTDRPGTSVPPDSLAYAIYTSGSTGKPKGVLLEHRNVNNFFVGMDAVVEHDPPGVWLAVTSLSFDISVLELFWTLARGFEVVVFSDGQGLARGDAGASALASRAMDFGLFMWGNDDGPGPEKYRLMLDGARYFDQNGFDSVWTPERHFHAFGGPFPNPSVTGAAIAAVTERLSIRSGSCVSPLHHPIRVAEEWSVVDNLSGGRVGLSFAAGWQPNDFVLRPESFPGQKQVMIEQIDVIRRLWRGETVEFENPMGEMVGVNTLPRPVQPELPYWITTAGNADSYRVAGSMGANVLTHLLGQTLDEVGEKIAIYRDARREAGFDPATGVISLMLHTFVGDDDEKVKQVVRQPMKDYLGASMKLVLGFAWTFPAFKRPGGPESKPEDLDLSTLSEEESDAILEFAFDRYFETSGLFGTPETCARMIDRCKIADVDEIACLLDFGVDTDLVMESLPALKTVRDRANEVSVQSEGGEDFSFAAQVRRHAVTHLQCTPSMARLLLADPDSKGALGQIQHLMIGGEAFPAPLAAELAEICDGSITNMYGPTETTIWSSTQRMDAGTDPIPIGRPIANTRLYILDRYGRPLPPGVPGELHIGGDGVARGYHGRPELTQERFVPDPFSGAGARMYKTGDLTKYRPDGVIDFIGRIDSQVKIRGYRIELGEIEATLDVHPDVRMSGVLLREDEPGDQRLVAYVVGDLVAGKEEELRAHMQKQLPDYMVPNHIVILDRMPLTPNGKIDRKALPAPHGGSRPVAFVEPEAGLQQAIAQCWRTVLKVDRVGVDENFFDIGGHSLLVVQLHRELTASSEHRVSLVDLYRFPTVRSLSDHLSADGASVDLGKSEERAEKRKAHLANRRRSRS